MRVKPDATDVSVIIRIIDSTDGTPETGVEHNTAGIDMWYRRDGAAVTSITEVALASLTTAHTDGGIEHIDDGYYRLDVPDAAFASGVDKVMVGGTVTDMIVIGHLVELDAQMAAATEINPGTISGSPATTSFVDTDGNLSSQDDAYNDRLMILTSGTYKGFARTITDYVGSTNQVVFDALPGAPTIGDEYIIV